MLFRYMEEAEHAVWRAAGLDIFAQHEENSWPRISAHFDFKAPLRFQDEFTVHTEMAGTTRSTIQWAHTVKRGEVEIGRGTITAVYVTRNRDGSMKSAELPPAIISKLRSALSA